MSRLLSLVLLKNVANIYVPARVPGLGGCGQSIVRCFASRGASSGDNDEPRITVTDDATTIVCWHPKARKDFPYEHSLPFTDEHPADKSVFKFEHVVKGENLYYQAKSTSAVPDMRARINTMEEVQALTYTTKGTWKRRRYDGLQMRPAHPRKGV